MIKRVACLLATALLLFPATSNADGKGEGMAPAPAGGDLTGVYYPPQDPRIPDLDLAPNEMLNRNVRILRTTNKAQLNRYVPVAYSFNNVNPFAVRRFLNRAIESEDGGLFTFVSPEGNSGRILAMIPEYQIPALDKLVAATDRADLTSSSGTMRAYVQLKHRRADLSDIDFLNNFGIYLTVNGDEIIIDPEQNAVFIEDAPSGTEWLLAALEEELDLPTPQVLASVNVYEVDGTNNARLGNDYIAWKNGPGQNLFAFGAFWEDGETDVFNGPFNSSTGKVAPTVNGDFDAEGYNFAFNFEHSSAFFDFLVQEGQAEVLTKAKLAALNTRTARITAGDQLLYYAVQTTDVNGVRSSPFSANDHRTLLGTGNQFVTVTDPGNPLFQNNTINLSGALSNAANVNASNDIRDNDIDNSARNNINGDDNDQDNDFDNDQELDNDLFFDNDVSSAQELAQAALIFGDTGASSSQELVPVEADLEMQITPVIYENGVEVDVVGDLDTYNGYDDSGFPRINNRAFSTQVRMGEGQEIVLGGIARTETTRAANKPPALGSLPVIGFLFGQENTRRRESTVVMTLAIDQIVRFDGDQAGKTADEQSLLDQATGAAELDAATSHMDMTPGVGN